MFPEHSGSTFFLKQVAFFRRLDKLVITIFERRTYMEIWEPREVLEKASATGADFAELFFEDRHDNKIRCSKGVIGGVTSLHICGVGLHLLKGTSSVYLYGNDLSRQGLLSLAETGSMLIRDAETAGWSGNRNAFPVSYQAVCPVRIMPEEVGTDQKVLRLQEMDQAVRTSGVQVQSMELTYFDQTQQVRILNSDGLDVSDTRVFTRVRLAGTVGWNGRQVYSFGDFIRPAGYEAFEKGEHIPFASGFVKGLEKRLQAPGMKSCVLPVVFGEGSPGVFWHEACGHNLETEAGKSGPFWNSRGKMIASRKVTLIDDGSVPGLCGSERMDDEGHPTQKNILIDHGKMVLQMADILGGRLTGTGSTGSGRRQSYTYAPCARMHNTYLAPGEDDDDEMISSLSDGIYVTEVGGGSSGRNFSVAVNYGYRIRGGRLAEPISGITLSGDASELIQRVERVGRKLVFEEGGGYCGASSGLVMTTNSEPRFRISEMNVGGTE